MINRRFALVELLIALGLGGCTQVVGPESLPAQRVQNSRDAVRVSAPGTSPTVRPAAVAGLFYPAGKETLSGQIDKLLGAAKSEPIGSLRGLVVPHAGYEFSGPTAAEGYKQLVGRGFRTAVVMAPSHSRT